MAKTAFITGIGGQDGSYLTELLLDHDYVVHGLVRRKSTMSRERLDNLTQTDLGAVHLHYGDVTDSGNLTRLLLEIEPDEVYNLAAQSHVRVSFDKPGYTTDVNAVGCLKLLEAVRLLQARKEVRFYQASTSEMFGGIPGTAPQNEETPFHPRSPYAASKVFAHHSVQNYREAYGLFACSGILFNHESPRRGENFVTRKVTRAAARIKFGLQDSLQLGNLDARRDWGFAGDYVRGMWMMLQADQPRDYVLATGQLNSVRDVLDVAFRAVDLDWKQYVTFDERQLRPTEVEVLCGDASRARAELGWESSVDFEMLIEMMVAADMEAASSGENVRA